MLWSGSFVTRGSGAVGEVVASHNRGGQYLRERVTPTDPETELQIDARDAMGVVSARFSSTLTDDQRTTWLEYAQGSPTVNALGASIVLTAQQQYVRTNVIRELLGLSLIDVAPTIFGYGRMPIVTDFNAEHVVSSGDSTADLSTDETPTGGRYVPWYGMGKSQGVSFYRGPYRMGTSFVTQNIAGSVVGYDWTAGEKVWCYVRRIYDDGRTTGRSYVGPVTVVDV